MTEEQSEDSTDSTSTATVDAIAVYLRGGATRVCPVKAAHAHRLGALWMCPHGQRHAECGECIELVQLSSEEVKGDTAITNPINPLAEGQQKSCPQGHALTPHTTEGGLGMCDGCSRSIAHHTRVMDCTVCDYFLCDGCDSRARHKLACNDNTNTCKTNDDAAGPGWVAGKERVLYITVTLDKGRRGDIHVHAGDAPYDALAVRFCERHALGPELVTNLTAHIETLVRKHGRQDGGSGGGETAVAEEAGAKTNEGEGDGKGWSDGSGKTWFVGASKRGLGKGKDKGKGKKGETNTATGATDEAGEAGEADQASETKGSGGGKENVKPPEHKLRVGGGVTERARWLKLYCTRTRHNSEPRSVK